MGLKFVPPKNVARYAYAVEYDKSQTKFDTYDNIGAAKNALQHKLSYSYGNDFKGAYLLENVDGEWFVLHTITREIRDSGRMPWQKEVEAGGWRNSYKIWRAVPMTRDEYAEWRLQVERERTSF